MIILSLNVRKNSNFSISHFFNNFDQLENEIRIAVRHVIVAASQDVSNSNQWHNYSMLASNLITLSLLSSIEIKLIQNKSRELAQRLALPGKNPSLHLRHYLLLVHDLGISFTEKKQTLLTIFTNPDFFMTESCNDRYIITALGQQLLLNDADIFLAALQTIRERDYSKYAACYNSFIESLPDKPKEWQLSLVNQFKTEIAKKYLPACISALTGYRTYDWDWSALKYYRTLATQIGVPLEQQKDTLIKWLINSDSFKEDILISSQIKLISDLLVDDEAFKVFAEKISHFNSANKIELQVFQNRVDLIKDHMPGKQFTPEQNSIIEKRKECINHLLSFQNDDAFSLSSHSLFRVSFDFEEEKSCS